MTIDEAVTYIEDIKNGLHETGKDFPYRDEVIPVAKEALDIAIKALEQEPIHDILDKIKAEIKGWQDDIHDNENDADEHDFVFERIYEIFDEYKKESEDKNE